MSEVALGRAELWFSPLRSSARNLRTGLGELFSAVLANERMQFLLVKPYMVGMADQLQVLKAVIGAVVVDVMKVRSFWMWFSVMQPPHDVRPQAVAKRIGSWVIGSVDTKPASVIEMTIIPAFGCPRIVRPLKLPLLVSSHR